MTTTSKRYWPDLAVGESFNTQSIPISEQDILDFAADFDPQPYHLDGAAADESIFGGLCASGWQVTALMMRLLSDTFTEAGIDLLGTTAVSRLRWRKPVFAQDSLSSVITITGRKPANEDPRFGYVDCDIDVRNQHGDSVIVLNTSLMIGCGEGALADG